MLNKENIILVTGATDSQGGAVASALLKSGNTVRVIVRESVAGTRTVSLIHITLKLNRRRLSN